MTKLTAPEGLRSTALFVPLKRRFFDAFERGEKAFEYREYGPRWNERTCWIGRPVTLSMGYGKHRRLHGKVVSFYATNTPSLIPGWSDCFGDRHVTAACIGIEINRTNAKDQAP